MLISGDITTGTVDSAGVDSLRGLLSGFLGWQPVVPKTPRGLAEKLAPLTRYLKNETARELSAGNETLQRLAKEWRELLFPEGDETRIADAYAQTVTFSLLLARLEGAGDLSGHGAVDALKRGHPLLSASLKVLKDAGMKEVLQVPMSLLERFIGAVDLGSIGTRDETWLYFYEYFLQAYNPAMRKTRGVYFTPMEVVRCQVRLADHLLRTRLGKPKGLADDEVVVLDPAVGTGAYPLAALDLVERAHRKRFGESKEVIASFAGRLYAFEVLVGPYAIARMRLARHFREAGIGKQVPLVYLTDTLADDTPANDDPMLFVAQEILAEEGRAAQKVKDNTNVMVCMGNPPWYRETTEPDTADSDSSRDGGWVRHRKNENGLALLDDFVDESASEHLKNLYNDYVYFWRWALWKVFETRTEGGLVTFVTSSSYLRGPGFGGMRKKMRETFDHLWIIDLEGDKRSARKTSNVFDHRTPSAIAIGVREGSANPARPAQVHERRLLGTKKEKLELLDKIADLDPDSPDWRLCSDEWSAPFALPGTGAYFTWPQITALFPYQLSGVQYKRTWPIGETKELLQRRWDHLLRLSGDEQRIAFQVAVGKRQDRVPDQQYLHRVNGPKDPTIASLNPGDPMPPVHRYSFRSFDRHWAIADNRVGDYMRRVWLIHSDQQTYITTFLKEGKPIGSGPAATAAAHPPDLDHFKGSGGGRNVIPLWKDQEATRPNITEGLLKTLSDVLGATVSAEQFFAYTYGVLAQPSYTERFWDQLEAPPPRIPITTDPDLFAAMAEHGQKLLHLHTYHERFGPKTLVSGQALCTEGVTEYPTTATHDPANEILHVADGQFGPVTQEMWNYQVSGYLVLQRWLEHRQLKRPKPLTRDKRPPSPLNRMRPQQWEFSDDLVELIWVLEQTLERQPRGTDLLDRICQTELITEGDLPKPAEAATKSPVARQPTGRTSQQQLLDHSSNEAR